MSIRLNNINKIYIVFNILHMDILKTNPIEHKGAKIKIQNPNTDYMEVISLGKDYSSGFYSKIELVEGEEYDLEIIGELVIVDCPKIPPA